MLRGAPLPTNPARHLCCVALADVQATDDGVEFFSRTGTDHHFHWGQWVSAAAAVASEDPAWYAANLAPFINALVRDYANNDKAHPILPFARHKDWCVCAGTDRGLPGAVHVCASVCATGPVVDLHARLDVTAAVAARYMGHSWAAGLQVRGASGAREADGQAGGGHQCMSRVRGHVLLHRVCRTRPARAAPRCTPTCFAVTGMIAGL